MAEISANTLGREEKICAKNTWIKKGWQHLLRKMRPAPRDHIKDISPRLARDIGLSDSALAAHQHQWPSQTLHHPRG